MNILQEKVGNILVVKAEGRIDSGTSGDFESKIMKLIDSGEKVLSFDFSNIEFISSNGLRSFLVVAKKLKKVNGKLALFAMNSNIKEVFEMTGFSTIIPIFASENEALQSLADNQ
jgi:anti-anti-sigma factor